jgi:hypothetical protein
MTDSTATIVFENAGNGTITSVADLVADTNAQIIIN